MERAEAEAIYEQGREVVVAVLLRMDEQIERLSERVARQEERIAELERTFVEVRRRTKVIGRFPGETSALSLIWAVLELSSRGWRGVVMTPKTVAQIERLRRRQRASTGSHEGPKREEVAAA